MFSILLLSAANAAATTTADPTPPALRLGDGARPTRYTAEVRIAPSEEPFRGIIDIEIVAARRLDVLWLNAEELDVTEAYAEVGATRHEVRLIKPPHDYLGLAFARPLPKGPARLHLAYTGKLSSRDGRGAGRVKEGDHWYVATQFENTDARRVFPCFDEPGFKAPWRLTLIVPKTDAAFANAPQEREEPSGDWKAVRFAESKPLPTYAVAFAVGPWEAVDGGRSRSGTPLRILALRGQSDRAKVSAATLLPVLTWFEDYFGIPHPYEKLDNIAVPLKSGAMENPGLITYGTSLLLQRPGEETLAWRRRNAGVTAHEFAHLWFGDYVTMAWWDDVWLNESFATWLAGKMVADWKPEWSGAEDRVLSRDRAMNLDSLATARRVRQPIETADDISNAFDQITYAKGGQLLSMFERWLGPEVLRKGVHLYLTRHAHGNAAAADFLGAVSSATGRDIAPAFSSFLDQPGVPVVQMDLVCPPNAAPALKLRQERYRPVGSEIDPAATWQVPICVRWGARGQTGHACTLLADVEGALALKEAPACPDWVIPNEDGAGYYRSRLADGALEALLAGQALNTKERIALVGDLDALVRANRVPYARALALLPTLANDPSRHVVASSLALVDRVRELVPPSLENAQARLIRETYGARARTLGWRPRPDEDESTRALRVILLSAAAEKGGDPELVAEARTLSDAWLKDRRAIDPEVVDVALRTAARHGDAALFETWRQAAARETERQDRQRLLAAMGSLRDPEAARRAAALSLSDAFDVREAFAIVRGLAGDRHTSRLAYEFVKTNFDTLVARLPRDSGAGFASFGAALCDKSVVGEMESLIRERTTRFSGGPRRYAQSLEALELCVALREAQGPSAAEFLSAYAGT